mmetsp:Transcript_50402/g.93909  ORF Transcript_50402/g.93909 Transcript_50402/m.93909 type:complete len:376 (+) Transcript_50402:50-1177(+)
MDPARRAVARLARRALTWPVNRRIQTSPAQVFQPVALASAKSYATWGILGARSAPTGGSGAWIAPTLGKVPGHTCTGVARIVLRDMMSLGNGVPQVQATRGYARQAKGKAAEMLKFYRPLTPGMRGRITTRRNHLWKGKPYAPLTKGLSKTGGRNHQGRTTVFWRGGGHKRLYRIIDFKRKLTGLVGTVRRLEYDPNRSARIALVDYQEDPKLTHYMLAPDGMQPGDPVTQGPNAPIKTGNALPLANMPVGTIVHNVEIQPGLGAKLARAAGTSCTLIKKDKNTGFATMRLQSGEMRLILMGSMATVGIVSNKEHQNRVLGKAGANRWLGKRPHVRGVAMNPIDHPMGGGEGRTSGGRPSCTPWGVPCKGFRTRK